MDSLPFNYNIEDQKQKFSAGESDMANAKENFTPADAMGINDSENAFTPMSSQYGSRTGNDLYSMLAQQEPRTADTAPTANDIHLLNYRMSNTNIFDEVDSSPNMFANTNRAESVGSAPWTDSSGGCQTKDGEMIDTFDFLVKSLSSANNYVSMLTREQFTILRSIRPSLLYEFLQEIARIRSEKRMRRALPNECAFCKNNGEIEECFSSHALKDWRGRVLCPVLRAFRCPRCGATGDRAHTIKYCREAGNGDRVGLAARRRGEQSSLLIGQASQGYQAGMGSPRSATPGTVPPSPGMSQASIWNTFGLN